MEKEKMNQAERNAEGHAESIIELYRAYTALENGAESARADGCEPGTSNASSLRNARPIPRWPRATRSSSLRIHGQKTPANSFARRCARA